MIDTQNKEDPKKGAPSKLGVSLSEPKEIDTETLLATGKKILDEENQVQIFEILRCAVCFEIPKYTPGLQVKTCEKGHHFCTSCYKQISNCAICRGRFYLGRNFVVEELISKLGSTLGVVKEKLPEPAPAPPLTPGFFKCPYPCTANLAGAKMLQHIRRCHGARLVDRMRSNPHNGRFDWISQLSFTPSHSFTHSIQISDFGLVTVVVLFVNQDMVGFVEILGDEALAKSYQYRLCVQLQVNDSHPVNEHGITNCDLHSMKTPREEIMKSKNVLFVHSSEFTKHLKVGDSFNLYFSMWKTGSKFQDKDFEVLSIVPEVPQVIPSDRKHRRTLSRNRRKRDQRARRRQQAENEAQPPPEPEKDAL